MAGAEDPVRAEERAAAEVAVVHADLCLPGELARGGGLAADDAHAVHGPRAQPGHLCAAEVKL